MNEQSDPENQLAPPPRRHERQTISSIQIVFVAILSIGLLLVINFSGRIARGQQMEAERQRIQATIDVLEAEKLALLKQRDYAANDASVEHWAHTDGKMVREGEVLVIPIPGGPDAPTPTPPPPVLVTSSQARPEAPKWHLWWSLFFDGDPPF